MAQILNDESLEEPQDSLQEAFNSFTEADDYLENYLLLLRNERMDDIALKIKEQSLYSVTRLYSKGRRFSELMLLIKENAEFFNCLPKARTAKIIRSMLSIVASFPGTLDVQISLCEDVIDWCKMEKRTFLRQRVEAKLSVLLLNKKQPTRALSIITELLKELKKLDDKQMLTEAHLTESRIYHSLQNIPKSKASLTASRTAANSIYVVPLLQAEIDEMSGILHCEEADYSTAYSYFLEAFDAYDQASEKEKAITCLQYMILSKVLNDSAMEVPALLTSKIGIKHSGKRIEAMAEVAKAAQDRSLEKFKVVLQEYSVFLESDDLISHHLELLYDRMLETNLLKIINPYSCVEISHVAKLINQPETLVIKKLSQMILDHKFFGILDQGKGHLIIYDSTTEDFSFTKGVDIINNLGLVVDVLAKRSKSLGRISH